MASIQQPHPIGTIATSGRPLLDQFEDSKPELSHLAAAAAQHSAGATNNVSGSSNPDVSPAHPGVGVSSLGSLPGECWIILNTEFPTAQWFMSALIMCHCQFSSKKL